MDLKQPRKLLQLAVVVVVAKDEDIFIFDVSVAKTGFRKLYLYLLPLVLGTFLATSVVDSRFYSTRKRPDALYRRRLYDGPYYKASPKSKGSGSGKALWASPLADFGDGNELETNRVSLAVPEMVITSKIRQMFTAPKPAVIDDNSIFETSPRLPTYLYPTEPHRTPFISDGPMFFDQYKQAAILKRHTDSVARSGLSHLRIGSIRPGNPFYRHNF
ncbi:unnamed protein product [Cyprideis torosa]|uniref:Uncharacterized protein n=1 Tax=Cyprideis torosa TaxID=163714 RepID=A0A7R8W4H8_9CRUS|nr:unnamed protein product [Cyprideis torosa]CAG0884044.1 unnamed protein product [Cyprideis torosa]